MPRIVKRAAMADARAKKKIDKLQSDRMDYALGERKRQPKDKGLRKLSIDRAIKKARRLKAKALRER